MGHPTIFPTGVTIYDKQAAFNGFTVLDTGESLIVVDMNGREQGPKAAPKKAGTVLRVNGDTRAESTIAGKEFADSEIVETDAEGKVLWRWRVSEHFDELGFNEAAKNTIYRFPSVFSLKSVSALGANKRYDAGDARFHPDNIIWSLNDANIIGITEKRSGKIVYKLGPDWGRTGLSTVIGATSVQLIPKGFPGEGNLLVLDNGGEAGYGAPHDVAVFGVGTERRDYSRVLEFDPITLKILWKYTPLEAGHIHPLDSYKFYSPCIGTVERLENGNTLINEGRNGRVFEVKHNYKTVWEYVSPYVRKSGGLINNYIFHAVRVPYDAFAEFGKPDERDVAVLNVSTYRAAGAPLGPGGKVTQVEGVDPDRMKPVDDPNKWYDAGDMRFHPDNIIWDARNANILAITDKKSGKIVWRLGPDFDETPAARKLGWIIGQHHLHMIPRGLPGEGNLLVFDNGGWGGYGEPSGTSRYGINSVHCDYSRVTEFNPVTLEIVWEYTADKAGFADKERFYSPYISSAQRLPNGNTMITEGSDGRLFEVTPEYKTVWEYINPYYHKALGGILNMVYRAYRVPYEWIPQLTIPQEKSILGERV